MSQTVAAVQLTKRGLSVFRLARGTKDVFVDKDWNKGGATSSPLSAYEKFNDGEYNIGVWANGLCIVDADEYKPNFAGSELVASLPLTFTVGSASGGRHYYFKLPDGVNVAASQSTLAVGVDIKTNGGYVVGPSSAFDGKNYSIVFDAPVAELPAALLEKLQAAPKKAADAVRVEGELDSQRAIESARTWLQSAAPLAVEGCGGDACTYRVANHVMDRGLSPEMALELLLENWNERCSPPWDIEDLEQKINNAAQYRTAAIGRDNPTFGFSVVEVIDTLDDFERDVWEWNDTDDIAAAIPKTPWIVPGKILREAVTLVGAPGAAGKSLLALQWAVAVATGRGDLCGGHVAENSQVLVINNEDPKDELRRRLNGVVRHFQLDGSQEIKGVHLYSGHAKKFKLLLRNANGKGFSDGPALHLLKKFVVKKQIGVVIFDPLVTMHGASENNNDEMNLVMEKLTSFAAETRAAVVLIHHTSKPPMASSDTYAGNVNSIRGASATKDASRVALTLYGMSEKDGEKYGVPPQLRHRYVRLDDAKANLHLAGPEAMWFNKATVKLANGEDRGVLQPVSLQPAAIEDGPIMAAVLLSSLRKGPLALKTAGNVLAADPLFIGAGVDSVCRRFVDAFQFGSVPVEGGRVVFDRTGKLGGNVRFEPYGS